MVWVLPWINADVGRGRRLHRRIFGGRLVQAGRDVTFLVRPERARWLRGEGGRDLGCLSANIAREMREKWALLAAAKGAPMTSSLYRDLIADRPIEADPIVGDLLLRARGAALSTPLLAAAYTNLCVHQQRRLSAQLRSTD